jgi:quinolinate synthase
MNNFNLKKNINIDKGYVDIPVSNELDLVSEIKRLKEEKNAIILAHYYQEPEIQDIADFVGDSLALSEKAAINDADIIVFAGVHFMAETAKMLSPSKKVLLPDLNAGCSLADSCPADKFADFVKSHPDHLVVSYINTTAEVKALTDIAVTSSNAIEIVSSIPAEKKIIFAPDRNLGNYIQSKTGREMLVWDGACHVHQQFSLERILELKKFNPKAKIIAHPECQKTVLLVSDFIGSTAALLNYTKNDSSNTYIVATEPGVIHQMKLAHPEKNFLPAPPEDSTCACNDCMYMKMITLKKLYNTLLYELPEVKLDEKLIEKSVRPINKMLEMSRELGLIK